MQESKGKDGENQTTRWKLLTTEQTEGLFRTQAPRWKNRNKDFVPPTINQQLVRVKALAMWNLPEHTLSSMQMLMMQSFLVHLHFGTIWQSRKYGIYRQSIWHDICTRVEFMARGEQSKVYLSEQLNNHIDSYGAAEMLTEEDLHRVIFYSLFCCNHYFHTDRLKKSAAFYLLVLN